MSSLILVSSDLNDFLVVFKVNSNFSNMSTLVWEIDEEFKDRSFNKAKYMLEEEGIEVPLIKPFKLKDGVNRIKHLDPVEPTPTEMVKVSLRNTKSVVVPREIWTLGERLYKFNDLAKFKSTPVTAERLQDLILDWAEPSFSEPLPINEVLNLLVEVVRSRYTPILQLELATIIAKQCKDSEFLRAVLMGLPTPNMQVLIYLLRTFSETVGSRDNDADFFRRIHCKILFGTVKVPSQLIDDVKILVQKLYTNQDLLGYLPSWINFHIRYKTRGTPTACFKRAGRVMRASLGSAFQRNIEIPKEVHESKIIQQVVEPDLDFNQILLSESEYESAESSIIHSSSSDVTDFPISSLHSESEELTSNASDQF